MPLPFTSLLPFDGRVAFLDYEPLLPLCTENLATDDTSESASASSGGDEITEA